MNKFVVIRCEDNWLVHARSLANKPTSVKIFCRRPKEISLSSLLTIVDDRCYVVANSNYRLIAFGNEKR